MRPKVLLKKWALIALPLCLVIFPVTLRNYLIGDDWVLISANGGVTTNGGNGGGGGTKKLIIIILAVVLLLVIAIVAFLFLAGGEEEAEEEEIVEVTSEAEPLAAPIFLPLDSYIVNLKDGRRYLKTTIQLMLSEEMANAYLTSRLIEIKDIVLTELQNLSVEEVKQAESREALRQRLISAISQVFPSKPEWEDPEPIKKVLFEEFVLQ